MKKLIALLVFTTLFTHCKDDDDNTVAQEEVSNSFVYQGIEHPISYFLIYGFENSLNFHGATEDDSFGFGFSLMELELENIVGTYTYNPNLENFDPETEFHFGSFYVEEGGIVIDDGTIKILDVQGDGELVELEFNFIVDGETVTGYYKGPYN